MYNNFYKKIIKTVVTFGVFFSVFLTPVLAQNDVTGYGNQELPPYAEDILLNDIRSQRTNDLALEKCDVTVNGLTNLSRFYGNQEYISLRFDLILQKAEIVKNQLDSEGIDSSKLEEIIQNLETSLADFQTEEEELINLIEDTADMACSTPADEVRPKIAQIRDQVGILRNLSNQMLEIVKNDFRTELQNLQNQ